MQFMKIVNMEVNNPHIKQSKGSYFSPSHLQPKSNGTLVPPSLPVINGLKCSLPKAEIVTDPIIQLDNGDTSGIYLGDEDEPKIEAATGSEKDHIIDEDPLKTGEEEIVIGTPKFEGEYEWL
ncbi:uncharacterized protein LOC136031682 [Artemia franciscana]|uniref:uncharacterized protein LOC136031682 n=1 Tax=Artemia franciscana TaxID=6661 RepID=UPI0032DB57B4